MRLQERDHLAPLALAAIVALALAGCSRKATNTYQGYVEGKFVYIASPQSGQLEHLSVARSAPMFRPSESNSTWPPLEFPFLARPRSIC